MFDFFKNLFKKTPQVPKKTEKKFRGIRVNTGFLPGNTNLLIMDPDGNHLYRGDVTNYDWYLLWPYELIVVRARKYGFKPLELVLTKETSFEPIYLFKELGL